MLQSAIVNELCGHQTVQLPQSIIDIPQADEELANLADDSLLYYDVMRGRVQFPYPAGVEGLRRAAAARSTLSH